MTRAVTLIGLEDAAKLSQLDYELRFKQYKTLMDSLKEATRIVQSADTGGLKRKGNGDRLAGTGVLSSSLGEGQ